MSKSKRARIAKKQREKKRKKWRGAQSRTPTLDALVRGDLGLTPTIVAEYKQKRDEGLPHDEAVAQLFAPFADKISPDDADGIHGLLSGLLRFQSLEDAAE